ncbi:cell shape determination protein CcmA [Paramagnetospirillum caucaseum]|uniref:Cell shape determination protein CcmA n=1 Tax=Paramagnetospirillum caucaseum TaxID=1244869 RepID=M2ZNM0_9PROT|nr:cell shape determination protein CcmA [Paramagnetospirillum caucaseum]
MSGAAHAARNGTNGLPLSVIGADVRIVGNIFTQGEMQIDGQVEGDISCQRLLVGEGARITGEVTAETVQVHGELNGKINASSVLIAKSAKVTGDVIQDSLEIEAGASMEGRLVRKAGAVKALEHDKGNGAAEPAQTPPPAKPDLNQEAAGTA